MMSEVPSSPESPWSCLGRLKDPAVGIPGSLVIYSLIHLVISSLPSFLPYHLVTKPLLHTDPVFRAQMMQMRSLAL